MPPKPIITLKLTLSDVSLPVWRRIEVPSDVTLFRLAAILLTAMGAVSCPISSSMNPVIWDLISANAKQRSSLSLRFFSPTTKDLWRNASELFIVN